MDQGLRQGTNRYHTPSLSETHTRLENENDSQRPTSSSHYPSCNPPTRRSTPASDAGTAPSFIHASVVRLRARKLNFEDSTAPALPRNF